MSAPSLASYSNGISQVSGDNLNTFVQDCTTVAQLRAFTPNPAVPGLQVFMQGYLASGDGGQGNFYWSTTTGTDDNGITTVVPSGSTAGCWIRIINYSPLYTPQTVDNTSGNVNLTAPNVTNLVMVCKNGSTPTNTFPSAGSIIGALAGKQVGSLTPLLVTNANSGTMPVAPGSGVTFVGSLSGGNFSFATLAQKTLYIYIASSSAVTVYG